MIALHSPLGENIVGDGDLLDTIPAMDPLMAALDNGYYD